MAEWREADVERIGTSGFGCELAESLDRARERIGVGDVRGAGRGSDARRRRERRPPRTVRDRASHRRGGVAADPYRRIGPCMRLREDDVAVDVARPRLLHHAECVIEQARPVGERHAERGELLFEVPDGDPEDHAPARKRVECCDRLRRQQRMPVRGNHAVRVQPQRRRDRGRDCERPERIHRRVTTVLQPRPRRSGVVGDETCIEPRRLDRPRTRRDGVGFGNRELDRQLHNGSQRASRFSANARGPSS